MNRILRTSAIGCLSLLWCLGCETGAYDDDLDEDLSGRATSVGLYQAEKLTAQSGCKIATNKAGYTGTGFVDYGGNGTWMEFNNVNVAQGGNYTLKFRFATAAGSRQCAILINGTNVGNVAFSATGSWTTWGTASLTKSLKAGNNTIRIQANTSSGGPNLDSMEVLSEIVATGSCVEAAENKTAALSCLAGQTIASIRFASYGLPTGACPGGFATSSCHAASSLDKVKSACLNKSSCSVAASNGVFGDPCSGKPKKLAVVYTCSGGPIDNCPNDPNKTEPGQCGCGKAEGTCGTDNTCTDNANFVDAQGYRCSGWVGYDCNKAAEDYGYTAAQETQILSNCKKSCNLCAGTTDNCPNDPNKTEPGQCGCGKAEGTCSGDDPIYKAYYGMLHSHTGISDGTGTPSKAYQYARDVAKLDFFGIADHDYYPNEMTSADWNTIKSAANSYNKDGTFATFWGFEWTSDSTQYQTDGLNLGHVTIINSDDFCVSSWSQTRTMNQLMSWLSTREAIGFFNHPGQYNTTFDKFASNRSDKIVGMELWNRDSGFSYYYNDGFYKNDGNLGYFDEALKRGWYIGASGSDDNHSGTWGATNGYRMAVLATEKTRASIYSAMKARRFYSTSDKNLVLSFTGNGAQMGSKISGGTLDIAIKASDGNNEIFKSIRLLKNGVAVKEWTLNTINPAVTLTQNSGTGDYFYVIVRQSDGNEAISSPIFITSGASN